MSIVAVEVPAGVLWVMAVGAIVGFVIAFVINFLEVSISQTMKRRTIVVMYVSFIVLGALICGLIAWAIMVSWVDALVGIVGALLIALVVAAVRMNKRR